MGKRKLKFDVRKNSEKKNRYRRALNFALAAPDCTVVSIPFRYTLSCKLLSVESLHERMVTLHKLPAGWTSSIICRSEGNIMAVSKLSVVSSAVEAVVITIFPDFTWTIQKGQKQIPVLQTALLGAIPSTLQSVREVTQVLSLVDASKCCKGNDDAQFLDLAAWREGKFMNYSGTQLVIFLATYSK